MSADVLYETLRDAARRCETDQQIDGWLTAETGKTCGCGAPMVRFELLNGRCDSCRLALLKAEGSEDGADESGGRKAIGIPERYLRCDFTTWRGKTPERINAWRQAIDEVLLLSGPTGSGKTHLATALLLEQRDLGVPCFWASARTLPGLLTDELRVGGDRSLWRRVTRVKLLLLDDLGTKQQAAGGGDTFPAELLARLVDERYSHELGLIVTTNKQPLELYTDNPAIGSRLRSGVEVPLGGRDLRLGQAVAAGAAGAAR